MFPGVNADIFSNTSLEDRDIAESMTELRERFSKSTTKVSKSTVAEENRSSKFSSGSSCKLADVSSTDSVNSATASAIREKS